MNFDIPEDIRLFLEEVDRFIEREIKPLENSNDNIRFFDHRREDARTDWERDGLPNEDWEALLGEAKRRAIAAGIFSYPFPREHGGRDGGNLGMAIIREHLAAMGLGLHNDLQNEHSVVGNNIGLLLMLEYGTPEQQVEWLPGLKTATRGWVDERISDHSAERISMGVSAFTVITCCQDAVVRSPTLRSGLKSLPDNTPFVTTKRSMFEPSAETAAVTSASDASE